MASFEELRDTRIAKLGKLKEAGMDPYPAKVPQDHTLSQVKESFKDGKTASIVGRIMAIRGQGAILFAVLYDGTERFQIVFKKDVLDEKLFSLFTDAVDIGDFISATGELFTTQRGEQSLLVKDWVMATKAITPLPDKWHGLQDTDERYRKRYLDLLMNLELRDLLIKKSKFWDVTRSFLKENGFLEVETPTLEVTTGGAEATPFKTHHNDYDLDVYLRISIGELWQKRLMAAGFPKTFEIGRAYRNEGSSPDHLQEFTNMEFYWAYADYKDGMDLVKKMYRRIATDVFGTTKFTTRGHTFDLNDEWVHIDYVEEIKKQTGIDIVSASEKEMKEKLSELQVKYEGDNKERLTDTLWKYCRKNIAGPAFLVNHPELVAPLAKSVPGKKVVQMFQPILAGSELGKGYSELNDPIDQDNRFKEQQKLIDKGDTEAMMADHEFVEMLEHGMPPTCGYGFGERLFAFLADKPLRELQTFPLMRPKDAK
jgi:lysyl-tRNA synthetase class 2